MNPVRNSRQIFTRGKKATLISNGVKSFSDKVRAIVRAIPKGETLTYKEVARKAGNAKAARAVGAIMRSNYDETIPCHRVVASDGTMRGYNRGGVGRKRELLVEEGAL